MAGMTYTFARNERKFLITTQQRDALMSLLGDRVRPDEWGRSTVRSLYCDTPTHLMVRRSSEHPTYKEKIRIRTYGLAKEDGDVFLELKQKVKGVTYKRRAIMPLSRALAFVAGEGDPTTQIEREIAATVARYDGDGGLVPSMMIACEREAFFAADDPDVRLTFDGNIRCSDSDLSLTSAGDDERCIMDGDLVLLEVKCGAAMPLWLVRAMSSLGLRQTGFSKYGIAWKQQVMASGASSATDGLAPAISYARQTTAGMPAKAAPSGEASSLVPAKSDTKAQGRARRMPERTHIRLGGRFARSGQASPVRMGVA